MWADTCVMVLPCGNSAHIETGWMAGAGKYCVIYCPAEESENITPDLMYLLAHNLVNTWQDLMADIGKVELS